MAQNDPRDIFSSQTKLKTYISRMKSTLDEIRSLTHEWDNGKFENYCKQPKRIGLSLASKETSESLSGEARELPPPHPSICSWSQSLRLASGVSMSSDDTSHRAAAKSWFHKTKSIFARLVRKTKSFQPLILSPYLKGTDYSPDAVSNPQWSQNRQSSSALLLILGKTVLPAVQWGSYHSTLLRSDCVFLDSQSIPQSYLPGINRDRMENLCIAFLYALLAISTALCAGTTFTVIARNAKRRWTAMILGSWLALTIGALQWSRAGGTIHEYFIVLFPFLLSIGVSLGLLGHDIFSLGRVFCRREKFWYTDQDDPWQIASDPATSTWSNQEKAASISQEIVQGCDSKDEVSLLIDFETIG